MFSVVVTFFVVTLVTRSIVVKLIFAVITDICDSVGTIGGKIAIGLIVVNVDDFSVIFILHAVVLAFLIFIVNIDEVNDKLDVIFGISDGVTIGIV